MHQLRDAFNVARTFVYRSPEGEFTHNVVDRLEVLAGTEFMMLRDGRLQFEGTPYEFSSSSDPYIREFLS